MKRGRKAYKVRRILLTVVLTVAMEQAEKVCELSHQQQRRPTKFELSREVWWQVGCDE